LPAADKNQNTAAMKANTAAAMSSHLLMAQGRAADPCVSLGLLLAGCQRQRQKVRQSRRVRAEACLAHAVGNAVVQAYQRSSMLERRRPVMKAWASFLTGEADPKVVALSGRRKRSRPLCSAVAAVVIMAQTLMVRIAIIAASSGNVIQLRRAGA
jgi:hypothetical protein